MNTRKKRKVPFKYWNYKYNPITGFKTHRQNELVFNKERANR